MTSRTETERIKRFTYDELMARDKASLDIIWLRDESLEDADNLPPPAVIAVEIIEDLEAAEFGSSWSRSRSLATDVLDVAARALLSDVEWQGEWRPPGMQESRSVDDLCSRSVSWPSLTESR